MMSPLPLTPFGSFEEILGVQIHRDYLDPDSQLALVEQVRAVLRAAPPVYPVTPWGKPMSVAMTNAGEYGWVSGKGGYRYARKDPNSGNAWPSIPPAALKVWKQVAEYPRLPQCCLINVYGRKARMGLHRDADEADMSAPVVSISLGDPARFRIGGRKRSEPTHSTILWSGDVAVLGDKAREAYHGIDGIRFGESTLLPEGGRLNLTLRVVDVPNGT